MKLSEEIKHFFRGEVEESDATLETYSRDASLFKVRPKVVVFPKDAEDLESLVKWVKRNPTYSLTMRAAGSDMTGGPLGESIIADVTRHMNKMGEIKDSSVVVQPGVYYRDFEPKTLEKHLILPCYTASKNICALGGMIANNSAGEKTLRYGKMENYVLESKVILSDGKEYTIKPLTRRELDKKMSEHGFEGGIYRSVWELINRHKTLLADAKPKVSKNSAGYTLWNVWDGETFDLNKLIVGSQGTLGVVTEAKIKLVPVEPVSRLFVIFLNDLKPLADIVNTILPTNPESIECYDDASLKLAMRFLPKYFFRFIPEILMILWTGRIPKLAVLVEYCTKDKKTAANKLNDLKRRMVRFRVPTRKIWSAKEAEKYWTIRRESFNLLRKHIHNARTAPFVDDVVVRHEDMPEFLPRMRAILDKHKLTYTIAGHAGNGNFHIIPLMDMHDKKNIKVIKEVGDKVYSLVAEFKGSITGEHNDGIVRTPYLSKMYSPEVLELFKKTKKIFDPLNIFNPGKKVNGTLEYLEKHIAIE